MFCNSLKFAEEPFHSVSDQDLVKLLIELSLTEFAISSDQVLGSYVVGKGAIFTQTLWDKNTLAQHKTA